MYKVYIYIFLRYTNNQNEGAQYTAYILFVYLYYKKHLKEVFKSLMQSFFQFSICRYFVLKLHFCCMYNSSILHKPQHQLAIKQTKAAQCLCLFSLQHVKREKSQFQGRSFCKTNKFHICMSTSIQLLSITWSGFPHARAPRGLIWHWRTLWGRKMDQHHGFPSWTSRWSNLLPAELTKWISRSLLGGWHGSI